VGVGVKRIGTGQTFDQFKLAGVISVFALMLISFVAIDTLQAQGFSQDQRRAIIQSLSDEERQKFFGMSREDKQKFFQERAKKSSGSGGQSAARPGGSPGVGFIDVHVHLIGGRGNNEDYDIVPEWLNILNRHSDRFVIGSDSFFVSPKLRGSGPGVRFAQRNVPKLRATRHFLSLLPPSVARKIARDNAVRIYGLK
jgi:hypothetical protein